MDRRSFLRASSVVVALGLSGCGQPADQNGETAQSTRTDAETATPIPTSTSTPEPNPETETSTSTPEPDPETEESTSTSEQDSETEESTSTPEPDPEIVEDVVDLMERDASTYEDEADIDNVSELFLDTLKEDGRYTENGEAFVSRLERIEGSIGIERAYEAAVSVAEFDAVSDGDLETLDRWLNSPKSFYEDAVVAGPEAEFDGIVGGLVDTTGDGMRDGLVRGIAPPGEGIFEEKAPEIAELVDGLRDERYTEREIAYLREVYRHRQYRDNEYEVWHQAERLGLLASATEDGEITEGELWGIRNESLDRLINAQAEESGFDPEETDTSGDGFYDHLTWLLGERFDADVHPTEPNVFVEVATAEGVDPLTDEEKTLLRDLFENDPPDESIHLHLYENATGVEPIEEKDGVTDRARDHFERRGFGHHFVLLNDKPLDFDDMEDRNGANTRIFSWINGSKTPGVARANVMAHELGHSMGIRSSDFDGIDSEEYAMDEYRSVMNYNRDDEFLGFNSGEPFDDWEQMREEQYGFHDLDIYDLEEAWEDGPS